MSDFGDTEPDDQFSLGSIPEPEQVARRLHEERRFIGSGEAEWDKLPDDVRAVAVALIIALLHWLHDEGDIG